MTFDEAINLINEISYDEATDVLFEKEDLFSLINDLREEYAPTVVMTKEEFEVFAKAKFDEDSAEWLDDVEWGLVEYQYPKFFMAWLHPETIKVIE